MAVVLVGLVQLLRHVRGRDPQFRRVQGYGELPAPAAVLKRELGIPVAASATDRPVSSTARRPSSAKFHDERDILAHRAGRVMSFRPGRIPGRCH